MKSKRKLIPLPLPSEMKARKSDNPKNTRRTNAQRSKTHGALSVQVADIKRLRSGVANTNILKALDALKTEHEEAHNGYRRTLYRIIAEVVDHGALVREDKKLWAKFQSATFWQGKQPKRQEDAIRYALQWVFDNGEASLYWRGVKRLVENGLRGKSLINAIRRGGGVRKLAAKAAKQKQLEELDENNGSAQSNNASPLAVDGGDRKRSGIRHDFVLPFRFLPEDEKKFPYKDGSRINIVGVFNAKTMEVDVDSWEKV